MLNMITKFYFLYYLIKLVYPIKSHNDKNIDFYKSNPENTKNLGNLLALIQRLLLYCELTGFILIGYYVAYGIITWLGILLLVLSPLQLYRNVKIATMFDNMVENIDQIKQKIDQKKNPKTNLEFVAGFFYHLFYIGIVVYLYYAISI